jgi:sulfofructose kinase
VLWRDGQTLRRKPVFEVTAVDTLAAGDVYHGAFTLALAEGQDVVAAMRFAAAASGLKCARPGGIAGDPRTCRSRDAAGGRPMPAGSHLT